MNREERLQYQRNHYYKNKIKYFERNYKRRRELIAFIKSFKTVCSRCGYNECVEALDFHHKNTKEKDSDIYLAIRRGWSKEHLLAEIEKCIVLCANCHRFIHTN